MERFNIRKIFRQFGELIRAEWGTFWYATLGAVPMNFLHCGPCRAVPFRRCGPLGNSPSYPLRFRHFSAWVIAVGNLMLLSWGWRVLSPRFVLWTLYVSLLSSGAVAFFELFSYPVLANTFLAALLAGVCSVASAWG